MLLERNAHDLRGSFLHGLLTPVCIQVCRREARIDRVHRNALILQFEGQLAPVTRATGWRDGVIASSGNSGRVSSIRAAAEQQHETSVSSPHFRDKQPRLGPSCR